MLYSLVRVLQHHGYRGGEHLPEALEPQSPFADVKILERLELQNQNRLHVAHTLITVCNEWSFLIDC